METAWIVEPVCATTQNSLKDRTVNTTRPSVKDMEAFSAMVPQLFELAFFLFDVVTVIDFSYLQPVILFLFTDPHFEYETCLKLRHFRYKIYKIDSSLQL